MVGAALMLALDLDVASYDELRAEFLAMTAEAQRASGRSRAALVKLCAGKPGRQTVYNYAGDPAYTSFPKPALLEKYLACCDFTPEQVRFAVARCAEIRRRYPEAGKSSPRQKESPHVTAGHQGGSSRPAQPVGPPAAGGQNDGAAALSGREDGPVLSQPAGWSKPWRGLARFLSPKKVTAFGYRYLADPRVITSLSAATYEPLASEVWRPSHLVASSLDSEPPHTADRWWVGSVLRSSGVRVSPGRTAWRVAGKGLAAAHPRGYTVAGLVHDAYRAAGITLPAGSDEQSRAGVPVPFEHAEPGDILILTDGREGMYAGNGKALMIASPSLGSYLCPVSRDQVQTTRRISWESVQLADRPRDDGIGRPAPVDVPPGVENAGPAAPSDPPLPLVEAEGEPASTEAVMEQFERMMREVTAQVEACGHAADPGLAALRAIDGLAFPFPYEGSQTWLVRAAFKAIDLPLPPEIRFELPVMAVAVRHVDLRPGDIVFTESGVLGIYGGNDELVYLGPGGARATSVLQPALYVAAWRVTAVPARDGHGLVSRVAMVEHDDAGRLARIYRPGERRSGRHRRCPETAEVVAMVIEVIEEAKRRGVEMPLAGQELFTAALTRSIEFSSVTTAWDPVQEPVYPRDARLRAVQVVPTGGPSTATELLKSRLSTVPAARWSARNRPGVA